MERVSKGAGDATNRGKPAPFDTTFALLRSTQDASHLIGLGQEGRIVVRYESLVKVGQTHFELRVVDGNCYTR